VATVTIVATETIMATVTANIANTKIMIATGGNCRSGCGFGIAMAAAGSLIASIKNLDT